MNSPLDGIQSLVILTATALGLAGCGGGGSGSTAPGAAPTAASGAPSSPSSGSLNPAGAPDSKGNLMACGTQSATTALNGQTITLTVSYGVQNCEDKANPAPTGTAAFYVGLDPVGTVPLVNGSATFSFVSNAAVFTNATAVSTYGGDTNYNGTRTEFPLTQYPVSNNTFANAAPLSAIPDSVRGSFVGALLDTQAPFYSPGVDLAVGAWYKWVAPKTGSEVFKIAQGSASMYIFTGEDESNLTNVLGTATFPLVQNKGVSFIANLGQTYYIAVVDSAELASEFVINWTIPIDPKNP